MDSEVTEQFSVKKKENESIDFYLFWECQT